MKLVLFKLTTIAIAGTSLAREESSLRGSADLRVLTSKCCGTTPGSTCPAGLNPLNGWIIDGQVPCCPENGSLNSSDFPPCEGGNRNAGESSGASDGAGGSSRGWGHRKSSWYDITCTSNCKCYGELLLCDCALLQQLKSSCSYTNVPGNKTKPQIQLDVTCPTALAIASTIALVLLT